VHAHYRVPFFFGHIEDHSVPKDAGDVHEDVELAPLVQRRADEVFGLVHIRNVAVVRDRFAAGRLYLRYSLGGGRVVLTFAVNRNAKVVDDDLRALACVEQSYFAADAAARTGDDCRLTFELSRHCWAPSC
jgi:hypothetical protein